MTIGSWNRIDSQVMMVGATTIGDHNMIHTGAMINHNVHIGDDYYHGSMFVCNDGCRIGINLIFFTCKKTKIMSELLKDKDLLS